MDITPAHSDPTHQVMELIRTLAGPRQRDRISLDTELLQSKILDSFGLVELVTELDSRFGISIQTEDLTLENFSRAASIVTLVQRYQAAPETGGILPTEAVNCAQGDQG